MAIMWEFIKDLLWRNDVKERERKLDALFDDLASRPRRTIVPSGNDRQYYSIAGVPYPIGWRDESDAAFRARILIERGKT